MQLPTRKDSKQSSLKILLILVISFVLISATTAVSYAKYQSGIKLEEPTSKKDGVAEGKFLSVAGLPTQVAVTDSPGSNQQAAAKPGQIVIPDIGVNAQVESLGLTKDNAVDVPKSLWTTAWFNKSSKPGDKGPAMIVGHYSAYGRAVFANLKKLKPGQKVIITDEKNNQFTFQVTNISEYPQSEVPMAKLLGDKNSKPRLEIITCGGAYIKGAHDFTNRTVVTAEIVD